MADVDILARLSDFIDYESPELAEFLYGMWDDQQHAITYHELREAIMDGSLSLKYLKQWQHDYSRFIVDAYTPTVERAIETAAKNLRAEYGVDFYDPMARNVDNFIRMHGGQLIREVTTDQYRAINTLVRQAAYTNTMTVDQLARSIRPCVGLTTSQAQTTKRYYENLIEQGYSHKEAQKQQLVYAAKVHRRRAALIAQTEMATAYNAGWQMTIQQNVEDGVLPSDTKKIWLTAEDEKVCPVCGKMHGEEVLWNEPFSDGSMYPPSHPNCRCHYKIDFMHILQTPEKQPDAEPDVLGETAKGYTEDQQEQRKNLIANAEKPAGELWKENVDGLKPVVEDVKKGNGHFSNMDGKVHFNISDDVAGRSDQNPYALGFHEYGHNIDYLNRNVSGQYLSEHFVDPDSGLKLGQMVMQESREAVEKYYERNRLQFVTNGLLGNDNGAQYFDRAEKALDDWKKAQGFTRRSAEWKEAYMQMTRARDDGAIMGVAQFFVDRPEITDAGRFSFEGVLGHERQYNLISSYCRDVKKVYSLKERTDVSDMFEHFSTAHGGPAYPFGIGHGKKYWSYSGDRTAKETFAEMTSASIAQKESLQTIKTLYPKSYQIYLNMIRSVLP